MKVKVFGPNLRDQSKGDYHVHAIDCADCKHYGRGAKYGGNAEPFGIEVETKGAVIEYVYGDIMDEAGEDAAAYADEFFFAPCTKGLS